MLHELPNDLMVLGNYEIPGKSQNLIELLPSPLPPPSSLPEMKIPPALVKIPRKTEIATPRSAPPHTRRTQ